jgi:hypothetical protein
VEAPNQQQCAILERQPKASDVTYPRSIPTISLFRKPIEVIEPIRIVIEYIRSESLHCNANEVRVFSIITQKLRWHLDIEVDAQYSQFFSSLALLGKLETKLRHSSKPSLARKLAQEDVIPHVVLTALRYAQEHVESLQFEPHELKVVGRLARAI